MKRLFPLAIAFTLLALACGQTTSVTIPTLASSPLDLGRTVYGFFPSPPEVTLKSVKNHYIFMGQHADVVLLQQNVPWEDFVGGRNGDSQAIKDIRNQYVLAHQNGMEIIFVVDPLNGLNRREFQGLPDGWDASFANPAVRLAFANFTLRIVEEFQPRYLGLASEINTYADTHPDDFQYFLSLYKEVYSQVKARSPGTQIFVTFQWEELNNLIPGIAQGEQYQVNWGQVELFEPELDLWVISSYPFIVYRSGSQIPSDYYSPLLERTKKPLAVAEGGYTSKPVGAAPGTPQDQVEYLNAIHSQIGGERLAFWIYLILSDFNLDSYARVMRQNGQGDDVSTLGMFASVGIAESDGTPKPALEVWDEFRSGEQK